jgi:hypothetical protein
MLCASRGRHKTCSASRVEVGWRLDHLYYDVWMTRGPFRQLPKSLCDFGDVTPHMLVGGAQTTLTATASARADRRDCPSEAWRPRGKTHTPPLDSLDRRAGATGAVGMGPNWLFTVR